MSQHLKLCYGSNWGEKVYSMARCRSSLQLWDSEGFRQGSGMLSKMYGVLPEIQDLVILPLWNILKMTLETVEHVTFFFLMYTHMVIVNISSYLFFTCMQYSNILNGRMVGYKHNPPFYIFFIPDGQSVSFRIGSGCASKSTQGFVRRYWLTLPDTNRQYDANNILYLD